MLNNLGAESQSFLSGPDAQAESRRKGQASRDKSLISYDQNKLSTQGIDDSLDFFKGAAGVVKGQGLLDRARGPKAPMLDAGTDIANPALTRETSPEGSLKADQLLASASEPMTLDGVVDDVMDNQDEGKFKPAGEVPEITPDETPKAQDFVDKIDAPKFDPSKLVTKDSQGNYV